MCIPRTQSTNQKHRSSIERKIEQALQNENILLTLGNNELGQCGIHETNYGQLNQIKAPDGQRNWSPAQAACGRGQGFLVILGPFFNASRFLTIF